MIRDEFGRDIVTLHEICSGENDDFAEYECPIINTSDSVWLPTVPAH